MQPAPALITNLVKAAAERYGTPLYVYDGDGIEERVRSLERELRYRPLRLYYSAKANPAVGIATLLRRCGVGLDACSPGDLELAARARFDRADVSYTGFGATDAEFQLAAQGAGAIVVDSIGELERLAELGTVYQVGLRVNPGITAGFHPHVTAGDTGAKFGIPRQEALAAAELCPALGLELVGLHAHLGSDILDPRSHVALLRLLSGLAERIPSIRWVNLGGGFGTPRRPSDQEYAWAELGHAADECLAAADGRQLELRLEPGAYFTMDAGVVVGRVIDVRESVEGGLATAVTDASTNQLVSVLLYGAHHAVHVLGREEESPRRRYRIVGNLMQAGDVLVDNAELPVLEIGDLLALEHAGAYAACRAATFNQRPRPPEVLLHGDQTFLLRRRESLEELFARDEDFCF
jgi:diaminopimelate decarboxylase